MKHFFIYFLFLTVFTSFSKVHANKVDAQKWLNIEITKIIDLYKDKNTEMEQKLSAIESAINNSFAGNGIARFVAGNVWNQSTEKHQKEFVLLFKEHLYLTIGSLMQGYSNQNYEFIDSKEDTNQNVFLIDMEIENNDQKTLVTWRVKKAKEKYYVIDLLVADISLVITKRAEFTSMLNKVENNLGEVNKILSEQNRQSYKKLIN